MMRGAIFDVDGTLLDSMPFWYRMGDIYLEKFGKQAEPNLGEIMFSMTMDEAADYLNEKYELGLTRQGVIDGINDTIRDFYRHDALLKEGVAELLEFLESKHIPMVIATATDRPHIEAAVERLGIAGYFKGIFTTSEVGIGKHHPDIFLRAAELIDRLPRETFVFEDGLYAIRTANAAGFKTIGIYDAPSEKEQDDIRREVTYYLKDYSNVIEILKPEIE